MDLKLLKNKIKGKVLSSVMGKQYGTVISTEFISSKVKSIKIKSDKQISFLPGQHIIFMIDGIIPRNYSIANKDLSSSDMIILDANVSTGGVGARTLNNLKVNDRIEFIGPVGDFKIKESKNNIKWFICVGSGISPLIPMIIDLKNKNYEVEVFHGGKNKATLIDLSFLNIPIHYSITDKDEDWDEFRGRTYMHVEKHLKNNPQIKDKIDFYICGQPQMVEDTFKKLKSMGIKKSDIIYEEY